MTDYEKFISKDGSFDWQLHEVKKAFFYNCDNEAIARLLRSNQPLTPGTRDFIAGIVEGKIKRKKGQRANNFWRDIELYLMINVKRAEGLSFEEAAAQVGAIYNMGDDAAEKAYKNIKPWFKKNEL